MYKAVIKPLLFKLQPETIHHLVASGLKIFFKIPGTGSLFRSVFDVRNQSLEREVFGIKFPNPVGFAAGFDKNAELYNELRNFGFGFIEIGTVTPKGQPGNPQPRSFRIPEDEGLINRMGFNNLGVDQAVLNLIRRKPNVIIGGNIGKNTATPNDLAIADYEYCFNALFPYVDYFVVNVSCPNVKDLRKLQDTDSLRSILNRIQELNHLRPKCKPVLLKISPDLTNEQIDEVIELVYETKIDGLVATNTTTSRDGLKTSKQRIEEIANGGLSGKPIRQRSTEVIRYISQKSQGRIPIIGVGGIFSEADALEKLNAGASLVQVYTGFIYEGPFLANRINKALLRKI